MSVDKSATNEQNRIMSEEISSLQKRLDTPSAEAIEWKVAYEEMKETLENQFGKDNVVLEDKITELDATIERLCSEKLALEERVSELTGAQNEIDSILKEVNRLESGMIVLQDEVEQKEKENKNKNITFKNIIIKLIKLLDVFMKHRILVLMLIL